MQHNLPRSGPTALKLQNPENLKVGIDNLEMKLVNIKHGIEELLLSLNANDKVSWPALLSKAASLSSDLSSVQSSFKKNILPNSNDEAAYYFRNQLVLPLEISPEINPTLLELTEHRVSCWNHETAPLFLRTKLPTEVDKEIQDLEIEQQQKTNEIITRQVTLMNKHLDVISNAVNDQSKPKNPHEHRKPTHNPKQTEDLVRMIYNGEGIPKKKFESR
uniref:Mediator of RNA polymerase II transcription subunit 8 n=1 Tax=Panagrolaimus sp. JU765 TaxID=591449 RepID=A0AC34R042_9BILA